MSARRDERFRGWPLGVAVAIVVWGALATPAQAGTVKVTTTADQYGSKPGDCSLREAVVATNDDVDFGGCNDPGGGDVIALGAQDYGLTREGSEEDAAQTGDLDITGNLRMRGAGAAGTTIDGNRAQVSDRVLEIHTGARVEISALTVRGGGPEQFGGGGIRSASGADLTIEDSVIRDNRAPGGAGGISGQGPLTIRDSVIRDNRTPLAGGGVIKGGAGTLLIEDSRVIGNESGFFGGGVYANPSATIIQSSTVRDNKAAAEAGGIAQLAGSLEVTNSVIKGNRSQETGAEGGGGIYGLSTTISLVRTTVSENRTTANGGGIFVYRRGQRAIPRPDHGEQEPRRRRRGRRADRRRPGRSSPTRRSAATAPGTTAAACTRVRQRVTPRRRSTTSPSPTTSPASTWWRAATAAGSSRRAGRSSSSTRWSGTTATSTRRPPPTARAGSAPATAWSRPTPRQDDLCVGLGSNNLIDIDPKLKPLADNGGPTLTHALKGGSPALEAGNTATPGSGSGACEATDQRGTPSARGHALRHRRLRARVAAVLPSCCRTTAGQDGPEELALLGVDRGQELALVHARATLDAQLLGLVVELVAGAPAAARPAGALAAAAAR